MSQDESDVQGWNHIAFLNDSNMRQILGYKLGSPH
jgi:hypothetical protein